MCHQYLTAPVSGGSALVEQQVEIPGEDRTIPAFFVRPEDGHVPSVLIIHDVWGANPFYHDVARRLAGEGFAVLLPDFFVREGALAEQTRDAVMERRTRHDQVRATVDIAEALAWLRAQTTTTGKVGTVGFCMGGTLVFLAAARQPVPDASVAFYGFPSPNTTELAPLAPIDEVADLRSPLLALWGDQDHGVGMDKVEGYREALTESGAHFEFVIYPGAPHGFLTFDSTSPSFDAAKDAWKRTVAFLHETLSAGAVPVERELGQ